ncbi:unnamed protein product [Amoebophrya sp. A25]|nr:unnamed protein product [Amoebophrya sp. A25]|eukprot:GSA25T00019749001.1
MGNIPVPPGLFGDLEQMPTRCTETCNRVMVDVYDMAGTPQNERRDPEDEVLFAPVTYDSDSNAGGGGGDVGSHGPPTEIGSPSVNEKRVSLEASQDGRASKRESKNSTAPSKTSVSAMPNPHMPSVAPDDSQDVPKNEEEEEKKQRQTSQDAPAAPRAPTEAQQRSSSFKAPGIRTTSGAPPPAAAKRESAATVKRDSAASAEEKPSADIVSGLVAMGFGEEEAGRAALATGNSDIQKAMDWLLQNPTPKDDSPKPAKTEKEKLDDLMALGFPRAQTVQALKQAKGNQELAASILLGEV